jgi:hypothetical protein
MVVNMPQHLKEEILARMRDNAGLYNRLLRAVAPSWGLARHPPYVIGCGLRVELVWAWTPAARCTGFLNDWFL